MREIIQIIGGILVVIATAASLFFLATSEMNFMDIRFGKIFGLFLTIASIAFFILTRNKDNEETNPEKERTRR